MPRKNRRAAVWQVPRDALASAIADAYSYSEVFRSLGLRAHTAFYHILRERAEEEGLDLSHFTPKNRALHRPASASSPPLESVLTEHFKFTRGSLKRRLIATGLLPLRCAGINCPISTTWLEQPLVLQLDHINGVHDDHRLENLRLLCPNCHSQTTTFTGRNFLRTKKQRTEKQRTRKTTGEARIIRRSRPSRYPNPDVLQRLVWERPALHVATDFGVSSSALKRHCKKHNIETPPLGYWAKKHSTQLEKIAWPSDDELRTELEHMSASKLAVKLGVAGPSVIRRCHARGIELKPNGYWAVKARR